MPASCVASPCNPSDCCGKAPCLLTKILVHPAHSGYKNNFGESGLWFAPLSLRAARGALVRRSVQKSTKCGTHRLDHLCAPLFVLPRLSLWERWREAPERARTLTKNGRRSDDRALTKTQLIAAQRFFPLWLALSVTSGDTSPKGRGRTSAMTDRKSCLLTPRVSVL